MTRKATSKNVLARKLALMMFLVLSLALLLVGAVLGLIEHRSTHALMVTSIAERVQSIVSVLDASDAINRAQVQRSYRNFRRDFEAFPEVDETTGEFKSLGVVINGDFGSVQRYTKETAGVATVYARKGNDLVAISTSLRKEDGTPAMDEVLGSAHPAFAPLMAGKPYTGAAQLYGRSYMTHMEPAKNAAGKVVGAFLVASDISLQQQLLEKQIADTRFFESGGIYLLHIEGAVSQARFAGHPLHKDQKVVSVLPQAEIFLSELDAAPNGYLRKATAFLGNPEEDKWAVVRKTKAGDSWLVAEVSEREAMAQYWSNLRVIWILLLGTALLLGAGLFVLIYRTVSAPVDELIAAVTVVSAGDLTQEFRTTRDDEIGSLVVEVEGLRQCYLRALSQVRSAVARIGEASTEIASGNQDLSTRTEQAAGNLQAIAGNIAQLTATVKQSAESALEASGLAASAVEVAAKGGLVVQDVIVTMNDLNESSRRIADISSAIDGIAFQTNILALNAAVEAARAGEEGRGFAVVAGEVRSLAKRSADAAKEIKALIADSVERVESGARLVEGAGETMNEIVASVHRVSGMIEGISAAAAGQSDGIEQVSLSISQLDQTTQQNAAMVEQSTAASESLRDQAHNLALAVSTFKLDTDHIGRDQLEMASE